MTYRELLQLYKQGKLDMEKKKQVEAEIEKQDAISEFLYEEGDIPDFSDLENGEDCFNNLDDKNQKAEWQDSKIDGNIEKRQGNLKSKREDDFILPKAVSKFYYDPNEAAGAYEGMTTTRMSLDLSVYSELYLPGNYRDQVNAVSRGYGEYDIVIPQTYTWTGKFTSVSGRLVRGKLTLYDNNILSRPALMFYLPGDENAWEAWETDENGKETKVDTEARKQESIQYSKEEISGYNDNDWYTAYVSINELMDYKDFIDWFEKLSDKKDLEWGNLWCAVHTEEEDGYCGEPNIGCCPYASGSGMSWDKDKYPYLSLLDNADAYNEAEVTDADAMQTHFTSMLSYMQDHDDILSMMGQSTDYQEDYQNMIDYVKKSGLKIHGFAISTKKKTLLELYKEDVVSYIQTTPQN